MLLFADWEGIDMGESLRDGPELVVRDISSLVVPRVGSVREPASVSAYYEVVFPADAAGATAANTYLADLGDCFARPLTLRSYGYDLLRWFRFLAAIGVAFDAATRSDYVDFVRWLGVSGKTGGSRRPRARPVGGRLNRETGKVLPHDTKFDPATMAHSRIVLHEFYEFLLDRGQRPLINPVPHSRRRDRGELRQYPHHNPMQDFVLPRQGRRRYDPPDPVVTPRHMTDEHFERFWAELGCDRDRALMKVAVDCGARPGELLGLSGEDVDWGDALVHVVRKGGRKAQWLPVSGDAVVWLRRYQASTGYVAGPEDPVWVVARGACRRLTYGAYRAVFTRINGRLGTNWTAHDLRHTACVRMLDAGMDLYKVQEIMGHEDLSTTQRYLRPRLDELIVAQREAQARPRPAPAGPGIYAQHDIDALFGRGLR